MKPSPTAVLVFSAVWAACVAVRGVEIPTAFPTSRYQAMIDKSPFSLGTPPPAAVAPPPAAAPSFAQDLFVVGIAKLGNQDFVSIASRDQTQRFSLMVGEQNSDGVSVVSVQRVPELAKSKVTVKKGTEFGTIGFDEAAQNNGTAEGGAPPVAPPQPMPGLQRPNMAKPGRPGFQQPNLQNRFPQVRPVMPNVKPFRPGVGNTNMPQSRIRRPVIPNPR